MSFDTSDTAKDKIRDALKRHSALNDEGTSEKKEKKRQLREKFITELFRCLNAAPTHTVQTRRMSGLHPKHLSVDGSNGSEFFKDIANAVCANNVKNFNIRTHEFYRQFSTFGKYKYSFYFNDFRVVFFSHRESLRDGFVFFVSVDDESKLSGSETASEYDGSSDEDQFTYTLHNDGDLDVVYTTMRNLHNRLTSLECLCA